DETVEKTFVVEGMPRLRVRNVSGETNIRAGEAGQVRVVARKRVKGGSADRAKRLLENVEVRIEQRGNDIFVEPHLYEQERSWLEMFRGKRFRVDFDITVPRECAVDAQTVSGDMEVQGTRGPMRVESVSGDGPGDCHHAAGDLGCEGPARISREGRKDRMVIIGEGAGRLHVKTVSGDLTIKPASSSLAEEPMAARASAARDSEAESQTEADPE